MIKTRDDLELLELYSSLTIYAEYLGSLLHGDRKKRNHAVNGALLTDKFVDELLDQFIVAHKRLLPIEVESYTFNLEDAVRKILGKHEEMLVEAGETPGGFVAGQGWFSKEKEVLLSDASKKIVKHENLYGFCEVGMERSMIYSL